MSIYNLDIFPFHSNYICIAFISEILFYHPFFISRSLTDCRNISGLTTSNKKSAANPEHWWMFGNMFSSACSEYSGSFGDVEDC